MNAGRIACLFAVLSLLPSVAAAQTPASDIYSAETVWDWHGHLDDLPPMCGVSSWYELRPESSVADAGCIEAAMRQLGASESAVRFFETTGQFLTPFDERGAIDFGRASSPWFNMGRGEAVLLNGAPAAILMTRAFRSSEWKELPGYATLLTQHPQASPWLEYGGPVAERQSADGTIVITTAFDVRDCRACANLATFRAELTFDPSGYLAAVDVLPPGPPRT